MRRIQANRYGCKCGRSFASNSAIGGHIQRNMTMKKRGHKSLGKLKA